MIVYLQLLHLLCLSIIFMVVLFNSHIFHGRYTWKFTSPSFFTFQRIYMRIEWALMRLLWKGATGKFMVFCRRNRALKFIPKFLKTLITLIGNGEVYTLEECIEIYDTLFRDFPYVNVGVRICPCRQARGNYDKNDLNITDLNFFFSKEPGKKKMMDFTTFISLKEAKKLLIKLDQSGFVHTMFGACARYVDGSILLSICNCKRGVCIPMDLHLDYDGFIFQKPHNVIVIDQNKCKGIEECGKCLDICYFNARVLDPSNGKIKIINKNCMGCGLCRPVCTEGANKMKFLPKSKVLFYHNLFKNIYAQYKGKKN